MLPRQAAKADFVHHSAPAELPTVVGEMMFDPSTLGGNEAPPAPAPIDFNEISLEPR